MADLKVKISEFSSATQSKDSDEIAILQDGVNKKIKTPILEEKILNKAKQYADYNFINRNKLGVPNGVATLGSDGKLSESQRFVVDINPSFIPIDLTTPPSEVDGVFLPTTSGVYENYGGLSIDLDLGSYLITKIGDTYKSILLAVESTLIANNIEDLRSKEPAYEGQIITLLGYYEAGDKEPLNYKWTSEQGIDDGGAVINTELGSWLAVLNSDIKASVFGCKGDSSNDSVNYQKVIDYCIINNKTLFNDRMYTLNDTIIIDKDLANRMKPFSILSDLSGGVKSNINGYVFSSTIDDSSDFVFKNNNVVLGDNTYLFNGNKIIRLDIIKNHIVGGGVIEADTKWLQSVRILNNTILENKLICISFLHAFDTTINENTVEYKNNTFIESVYTSPDVFDHKCFNIRIENNCIEDFINTPIRLGRIVGGSIKGNYFEYNLINEDENAYVHLGLDNRPHLGLVLQNNTADFTNDQKLEFVHLFNLGNQNGSKIACDGNYSSNYFAVVRENDYKNSIDVSRNYYEKLSPLNKGEIKEYGSELNSPNLFTNRVTINNGLEQDFSVSGETGYNFTFKFETSLLKNMVSITIKTTFEERVRVLSSASASGLGSNLDFYTTPENGFIIIDSIQLKRINSSDNLFYIYIASENEEDMFVESIICNYGSPKI